MALPRLLKSGERVDFNWTTINALRDEVARLEAEVARLTAAVQKLRGETSQRSRGGGGDCCVWS
jgi:hypothetical protein